MPLFQRVTTEEFLKFLSEYRCSEGSLPSANSQRSHDGGPRRRPLSRICAFTVEGANPSSIRTPCPFMNWSKLTVFAHALVARLTLFRSRATGVELFLWGPDAQHWNYGDALPRHSPMRLLRSANVARTKRASSTRRTGCMFRFSDAPSY
jgi:hypothetical protein